MKSTDLFGTFIDTLSSVSTSSDLPRTPRAAALAPTANGPAGKLTKDEAVTSVLKTLRLAGGPSPVASLLSIANLTFPTLVSALESLQTTQWVKNENGSVSLTDAGKEAAAKLS